MGFGCYPGIAGAAVGRRILEVSKKGTRGWKGNEAGNRYRSRATRFLLRSATELEESCLTRCDNPIPIQSACDMDEGGSREGGEEGERVDFRGEVEERLGIGSNRDNLFF